MLTIKSIKEITPTNHDSFDLPIGGVFRYNLVLNDKRSLLIYANVSYPKVKILNVDMELVNHSSDYNWHMYPFGNIDHISLRRAKRIVDEMCKTGRYDEVYVKYLIKA